jgi:hypothetical protein
MVCTFQTKLTEKKINKGIIYNYLIMAEQSDYMKERLARAYRDKLVRARVAAFILGIIYLTTGVVSILKGGFISYEHLIFFLIPGLLFLGSGIFSIYHPRPAFLIALIIGMLFLLWNVITISILFSILLGIACTRFYQAYAVSKDQFPVKVKRDHILDADLD